MNTSYTILYVDDDHDDLMLISEAFEKYTDHLKVVHAFNGHEGLAALKKMKEKGSMPCLVILDINMPLMDGKQMLKKMREQTDFENLPVVLFSTSGSPNDRLCAEQFDADFITKPVNFADLETVVSEFVSRCRFEAVAQHRH